MTMGAQCRRRTAVTRAESLRLDAFVLRVGYLPARRLLGVGDITLQAGMEEGTMLAATKDRLFAALDREEAAQ